MMGTCAAMRTSVPAATYCWQSATAAAEWIERLRIASSSLSLRQRSKEKERDSVYLPCMESSSRVAATSGSTANLLDDSDRKSTRLNSSHSQISYAVFCFKKK